MTPGRSASIFTLALLSTATFAVVPARSVEARDVRLAQNAAPAPADSADSDTNAPDDNPEQGRKKRERSQPQPQDPQASPPQPDAQQPPANAPKPLVQPPPQPQVQPPPQPEPPKPVAPPTPPAAAPPPPPAPPAPKVETPAVPPPPAAAPPPPPSPPTPPAVKPAPPLEAPPAPKVEKPGAPPPPAAAPAPQLQKPKPDAGLPRPPVTAPAQPNAAAPAVTPPAASAQPQFPGFNGGTPNGGAARPAWPQRPQDRQLGDWRRPPRAIPPSTGGAPAPGVANAPPPAVPMPAKLDDLKNSRIETREDGGKRVLIQEPDNRVIVKQNNQVIIQSDEAARVKRLAPDAKIEQPVQGVTKTVVDRPGDTKVVSETDQQGQLIRRYRQDANGRETTIIDNRRRKKSNFGRNLAIGAGIGVGIVAGAAILDSIVRVPKPRVTIPRDKYIVRYEDASEDDVYEALSAPPVDRIERRYTLDEVRATPRLRDRMRRIDLDDINFEFGSWDVDPSEYRKLERIARAMMRVIRRNPDEVFLIEGYTDAVGSEVDNLTLSDRRAESVAAVLAEQFQVPFENLATQGYGEAYLKVKTLRPERANRRVAMRRITPLIARGGDAPSSGRRYDDEPRRDEDRGRDERYDQRERYDRDRREDYDRR